MTGIWTAIVTSAQVQWSIIATVAQTIWSAIVNVIVTVVTTLVSILATIWTTIVTVASTIWTTLVTVAQTIWTIIVTTITTIVTTLEQFYRQSGLNSNCSHYDLDYISYCSSKYLDFNSHYYYYNYFYISNNHHYCVDNYSQCYIDDLSSLASIAQNNLVKRFKYYIWNCWCYCCNRHWELVVITIFYCIYNEWHCRVNLSSVEFTSVISSAVSNAVSTAVSGFLIC